jgi:hypothetical protein
MALTMTRRGWIGSTLSLGALTGCGLGLRRVDSDTNMVVMARSRDFPAPAQRVAVAVFEAMRSDLASAEFAADSQFRPAPMPLKPDGSKPSESEVRLPPDSPAFWFEWQAQGKPTRQLVTLAACHFRGKSRGGRPVKVDVEAGPNLDSTTVVVRHDRLNEPSIGPALLDRIGERLAEPSNPPGSAEEAATFQAFFAGVEARPASGKKVAVPR